MSNNEIKIIRSDRKTLALQILRDGTAVVRAPLFAGEREINNFIENNRDWLEKHTARAVRNIEAARDNKLTENEIRELADKALRYIPPRCEYYSKLIGVSYGRITIRNQKTKWGSCSSKGNLNFNCLLMLLPDEIVDAVIVHELCHRKEMNHSDKFYKEVLKVMPDYKERNKILKKEGAAIMCRLP